jgi:hypothetical protein
MHITSAQSTYNAISPKIECAYDEPWDGSLSMYTLNP